MHGKRVWPSLTCTDLVRSFGCIVQLHEEPDAIHVFDPEAINFSQFPSPHCFSELLVFDREVTASVSTILSKCRAR